MIVLQDMPLFYFRILKHDELYDENGYVTPDKNISQAAMATPERLLWDIPASLENKISQAVALNVKVDNLHANLFDLLITTSRNFPYIIEYC